MKLKKLAIVIVASACLSATFPSYATNISDELIKVADQLEDIKQTNEITLSQAINDLKTLSDSEIISSETQAISEEDTTATVQSDEEGMTNIAQSDEEDTATVQPDHPYIQRGAAGRAGRAGKAGIAAVSLRNKISNNYKNKYENVHILNQVLRKNFIKDWEQSPASRKCTLTNVKLGPKKEGWLINASCQYGLGLGRYKTTANPKMGDVKRLHSCWGSFMYDRCR